MNVMPDARLRIDAYLNELRSHLNGFSEAEVREIVAELRSHILDKSGAEGEVTAAKVDAALVGLGAPNELAGQFVTDALLDRAAASRSPASLLKSLFRWAEFSVAGIFVLLGSIVGYFFAVAFVLVAILKPFHSQTAGLWTWRNLGGDVEISFRMGFGTPPVGSHEVLGWWIVPLGLVIGVGLVMLTTGVALWCVRRFRRRGVLMQS
jgi:hypothetical protein